MGRKKKDRSECLEYDHSGDCVCKFGTKFSCDDCIRNGGKLNPETDRDYYSVADKEAKVRERTLKAAFFFTKEGINYLLNKGWTVVSRTTVDHLLNKG